MHDGVGPLLLLQFSYKNKMKLYLVGTWKSTIYRIRYSLFTIYIDKSLRSKNNSEELLIIGFFFSYCHNNTKNSISIKELKVFTGLNIMINVLKKLESYFKLKYEYKAHTIDRTF